MVTNDGCLMVVEIFGIKMYFLASATVVVKQAMDTPSHTYIYLATHSRNKIMNYHKPGVGYT